MQTLICGRCDSYGSPPPDHLATLGDGREADALSLEDQLCPQVVGRGLWSAAIVSPLCPGRFQRPGPRSIAFVAERPGWQPPRIVGQPPLKTAAMKAAIQSPHSKCPAIPTRDVGKDQPSKGEGALAVGQRGCVFVGKDEIVVEG